jgi:GTP-binding protein SAR1
MATQVWNGALRVLKQWGLVYENVNIIFLGLDNSGKTTLVYLFNHEDIIKVRPSIHPIQTVFCIDSVRFTAYELGDHGMPIKRFAHDYFPYVKGIVFLVDASDSERFDEAKNELEAILNIEDLAPDIPFLVLGNKIDAPGAVDEGELRHRLGLKHSSEKSTISSGETRSIELFMCSLRQNCGYLEGFQWLAQQVGV